MASKRSRSRPTTRPESTLPPLPSEAAREEVEAAEPEEAGAIDCGEDPPEDDLVDQVPEDLETPATDEELEETRLEGMLRLASALLPEDEGEVEVEVEQEREGALDAPANTGQERTLEHAGANTGQERASAREQLAPPSEESVLPRSVRAAGYTVGQFVLPWGKNCARGTCPKRPGTMAAEAWRLYGSGRRISDYLADRSMDKRKLREALAWDIERGLVTVADSPEG